MSYPREKNYPREKAAALFQARKRISPPSTGWVLRANAVGIAKGNSLECLVEVQGAIWGGASFVVMLSAGSLNKFSFSLLVRHGDVRAKIPLYRLDVNPTSPHMNPLRGPAELRGRRFLPGDTHEHVYSDNTDEHGNLLDNCSLVARSIYDPPKTFDEALRYIRDRLNIENVGELPKPETQGDLF